MPVWNQSIKFEPVTLSRTEEATGNLWSKQSSLSGQRYLSILLVGFAAVWLAAAGWAQAPVPQLEMLPLTGDPVPDNGTWSGPVLPIDDNTLYMVASGIGSIQQAGHTLATASPQERFFSLIKKTFDGPKIWSREMTGEIVPSDMAMMPDGGVVLVGRFRHTVVIKTNATEGLTLVSQGYDDLFIARYAADGSLVWLRTGGGVGSDLGVAVAVDNFGNIAVAGSLGGAAQLGGQAVSSEGMFLALFQTNGTMSWLRNVAGGKSYGTTVTADNAGHFYVGGIFWGSITVGTTQLSSGSQGQDILIMKYSTGGSLRWLQAAGETKSAYLTKLKAIGPEGVICAGGYYASLKLGPFQMATDYSPEAHNAFVARLDGGGNWVWAHCFQGDVYPVITEMDVDAVGEVYLGGFFWGTITLNGSSLTSDTVDNSPDAFLVRFAPDGGHVWGMRFGGAGAQTISGLKIHKPEHGYFNVTVRADDYYTDDYYAGNQFGNNYPYNHFYRKGSSLSEDTRLGRFHPAIALQLISAPVNTRAIEGEPVTLRVVVTGTTPTYQWYKDGKVILGANSATYSITAPSLKDEGEYSVVISNPNGFLAPPPVMLGVLARPQFVLTPESATVSEGESVSLQAEATGRPPPLLRWIKTSGGQPMQTGETFHLPAATLYDDGDYTLEAVNSVATNRWSFRVNVNLIPADEGTEFVHDPFRDAVYLATGTNISRFHLPTKNFLPPIALEGSLRGLDVSPDGQWLVVADGAELGASNRVFVVNLESGVAGAVYFPKEPGEGEMEQAVFGADGRVVLASAGQLRSYDPVSGGVVRRDRTGSSRMTASADRQSLALTDLNAANGSIYQYAVAATNIVQSGSDGTASIGRDVGVERQGRQFARVNIGQAVFFDQALQVLGTFGNFAGEGPGGVVYHPQQDIVYLSWLGSTEVRAYSTTTLTELARYPVENLPLNNGPHTGRLRLTRTGDWLLAALPQGIRYVRLPPQPPVILKPPQEVTINAGNTVVFTVTAHGPAGVLEYQWQKEGTDIPLATNRSLELPPVDSTAAGWYRVRVSNGSGFAFSEAVKLTVLQGDPLVTWNNPADMEYGTPLGAAQLNATAVTAGTFTYEPPAGTWLPVGTGQRLQVIFRPTDTSVFSQTTNTVFINVGKRPLVATTTGNSRQYGLPNPDFPLTLLGLLPGHTSDDIDELPVIATTATETSPIGSYPVSITGGSDNNYYFIHGTATLTVTKRSVSILLENLNQPYNGAPRLVTATTLPPDVPLAITYNGGAVPPTARGDYPVSAKVSDDNYQGSASGTLTISKGGVAITWNIPTPVVVGTALGGAQLNAVAAVPGIYSYTPPSGTILPQGGHPLTLVFTPLDSANYLRTTNMVTFQVLPLALANAQRSPSNGNEFRFDFNGVMGVEYLVEISTDLVNWSVLTTFTVTSGNSYISDPDMDAKVRRFYRVRPKP